jgi:hypothetical protein
MENENKKKFYKTKAFLIPMIAVFGLAGVFAVGYLVDSLVIQSDVYEPFSVEYSIIGQASNWDGTGCNAEGLTWNAMPESTLDVRGLYAGESRNVCFRITNLAQAEVDYTISNTVTGGDACLYAFGENSVSGVASNGINYAGKVVEVADDAKPVNDCVIEISVNRG